MIKKTLYFGNPAYLSCRHEQMVIEMKPEQMELGFIDFDESADTRYKPGLREPVNKKSIPVEDVGMIIIDHYGAVISQHLLSRLMDNNASVVICNSSHMPAGLFLNLESNSLQSEKFASQISASLPFKKQLWQQTVSAKIQNQAELLAERNIPVNNMLLWAKNVRSGDPDNFEARAAAFYWKVFFPDNIDFYRARNGPPPNNLLNYGYAILRAITARALSGSGLLPTLGIHHRNKYNAFCLADDIMEPYRPFVDRIVFELSARGTEQTELSPNAKRSLLEVANTDVFFGGEKSPLMVGVQRTSASLAACFSGSKKKILFPSLNSKFPINKQCV